MAVDGRLNNHRLVRYPRLVKAGSRTDPASGNAAEQRHAQGGRGGRVANAHFTDDQIVARLANGRRAGIHRMQDFVRVHGGCGAEIDGRTVQVKRGDRELQPGCFAQLVDGGATSLEIPDHLLCDFRREGADALFDHSVVAGEHEAFPVFNLRVHGLLPAGHPQRDLLQPAERAGRLGQLVLPRRRA